MQFYLIEGHIAIIRGTAPLLNSIARMLLSYDLSADTAKKAKKKIPLHNFRTFPLFLFFFIPEPDGVDVFNPFLPGGESSSSSKSEMSSRFLI